VTWVGYRPVVAGEQDVTEGLLSWLRRRGDCDLRPGLTTAELEHAEEVLRLTVPPLWRSVLTRALPLSPAGSLARYPDWRAPAAAGTRERVEAPVEGVLFDVIENGFWWHAWGPTPEDADAREALARRRLAAAPRLVPLFGHLYVAPDDESPVFSVSQANLFVPALSLADLPSGRGQGEVPESDWPIGSVPFWSELHAYSQLGHDECAGFGRLARGGS
jgi:hypothetical protein